MVKPSKISSSVVLFSSHLQSRSFQMSQFFVDSILWPLIRWPKYWSFSFNISPSNEHPGLFSFRMNWLDLLAVQRTLKSGITPFYFSILLLSVSSTVVLNTTYKFMSSKSFKWALIYLYLRFYTQWLTWHLRCLRPVSNLSSTYPKPEVRNFFNS